LWRGGENTDRTGYRVEGDGPERKGVDGGW
jgi:hypothetical protein